MQTRASSRQQTSSRSDYACQGAPTLTTVAAKALMAEALLAALFVRMLFMSLVIAPGLCENVLILCCFDIIYTILLPD